MKKRFEVHTHTAYSHDSLLNKWLYLFMLKRRGIDVVAITDHNEIAGALRYRKFLEKYNIAVVIGEEIFTEKGEVIGLFLQEKIEPGLPVRETMLQIRRQGGLVYIPHPYDEQRYQTVLPEIEISKNIDLIDLIEIHNGRNSESYFSEKQFLIAKKYPKLQRLVGSDAHTFFELGRNYNLIPNFRNAEQFMRSVPSVVHVKQPCIPQAYKVTKWVTAIKKLRQGHFTEVRMMLFGKVKQGKQRIE
ncbi:PHP domain-containing protein [Solibacillus sp. FSL K6-1523]|uniref:PHP domain-containing protein n=1 Tax=Solibacillus sp. FSL K6-1523 TaxID=2921471 RepID=UPI0030FD012B